ncbi:MAG: DUF2156 domain-containing protein [Clostridiales bacterium]|nr:DUF2156 domain-containing protein [Clostridiales bacterium]
MSLVFKDLTINDYKDIQPYFLSRPTHTCESHFLYHVIWKDFYSSRFTISDNGVLWLQNIAGEIASLPPTTSKDNFKKAFLELQEYFTSTLNKKLKMYLVDEEALELLELDEANFKIIEDRDSFDYIYDGNKLRALTGRKYSKKRNHINAFLKEYEGRFEYRRLDKENANDILEFTHKWSLIKNSDDPYNRIESEEVGIRNILANYPLPNTVMAGIYIDNKLEAFTVGSYDPVLKLATIHIEKANPEIRGLYPYINQQFLNQEFEDAKYINREDDMGIPSLRKAKESYYPIFLAKKYTIVQL